MGPRQVFQLCACIGAIGVCYWIAGAVATPGGDAGAIEYVFGRVGRGDAEFDYPRAMAISPIDGRVFVIDKTARVQRFSPKGEHEATWRMPEWDNGKPTGIYVDSEGRVWVPDTHYARIIVYDRDGEEQFRFGERGQGPGQFIFPTAIARDRAGFVYVSEYGGNDRISKFTPDLKFIKSFANSESGEGWTDRPQAMLFDDDEILWVADSCSHRICRYDRDGKFLGALTPQKAGREDALNYPFGLAFDEHGHLLIADRGNSRIVRMAKDGRTLGSWGTVGREVGQLAQPWSVAVGRGGLIYCLDSWNNRVEVIDW